MTDSRSPDRSFLTDVPVYVAHYDKAVTRRQYLTRELKECGFVNTHFFSYYCDRATIYNPMTRGLVSTSRALRSLKRRVAGPVSGCQTLSPREPAYFGNFLNHIKIWQAIAEGQHKYGLILEDDAFVRDREIFFRQMETIPDDLDVGYMHAGCGFTLESYYGITPKEGEEWVFTPERLSRTSCTYLLSRSAAQKLIESVFPVSWVVDHEVNYLQRRLRLNVYWTSRHGLVEGSVTGDNNYKSFFRGR